MPSTRPINTEHKDFIWKFFAKIHKQFDPPLSHKIKKKNKKPRIKFTPWLFEKLQVTSLICNSSFVTAKKKKIVREQEKRTRNSATAFDPQFWLSTGA